MKRNRLARIENDGPGTLDISSLVDICFLLLIYFIVTTTIMPRESDLPTGMGGTAIGSVDIEPMEVIIDESGRVYTGREFNRLALDADPGVRELPLLKEQLTVYRDAVRGMGEKCMVVIDAHDQVSHQRVVDVLNTLAGLDIRMVTFREKAGRE